ncbi:PREDICTED: uncharacterized protein LOC105460810 [Wasmannia auropunctata]|uniref:uncharacterized protein LOC105460810 n=1 Tax=Wasmannia auropunctata TaxID=64793 RepID=UPI0005EE3446|nr:PREDICTED: uncharacterized protein LOC105460810 [Wasmannia auropunctata]
MDIQYKAALLLEMALEDSDDEDLNRVFYSSSSDDEEETVKNLHAALILNKQRKKMDRRPRIEGFIEKIVPGYTAQEFKTHFRLLPTTFDHVLQLIGPSLISTKSVAGRKPIPAEKQLLMALWMMATPDSYRYCNRYI